MAREIQIQQRYSSPMEAWPPDDTEESVVGTNLHQTTILNLRWGINEAATLHAVPEEPAPWQALDQTMFLGCVRPNGSPYTTLPDVFVYRHNIVPTRPSVSLQDDGPPVLIIEVLSESTYKADLDMARGKGYSYAQAGVREYMTIDPTGNYLPEGVRAWRLEQGVYRPWQPEGDGRWHSREIAVAIGLEGVLATVFTGTDRRMLREGEVEQALTRERQLRAHAQAELSQRDRELAQRDRELAQRDQELAQRDAELERLRRLLDERQEK